jgi:hypothetical protein
VTARVAGRGPSAAVSACTAARAHAAFEPLGRLRRRTPACPSPVHYHPSFPSRTRCRLERPRILHRQRPPLPRSQVAAALADHQP